MKRRFSLFVNLATLVLCVCAIAIGVYSAKTASLNVGGTVGFITHNCKVELTGNIQACTSSEATERTTKDITKTTIGETTDTYALNLNTAFAGSSSGKMFFSDMFNDGKTVIVTLTIKNVSAFDITATANMPKITGAVTTVVKLANNPITKATSTDLSVNATTTLEIAITLNSTDDDLDNDIDISGTLFNFEKYKEQFVYSGAINGLTGDRTYAKMGKYNNQDLKWYIFAQGDGTNMTAVNGTVDSNGTLPSGTYWFISEYVLDCNTANDEKGIPFDDRSKTYSGSDIQLYLNNVEASASTSQSFAKKYNFSVTNNELYSMILEQQGRDLLSKSASGKVGAFTGINDQYFWLLSVDELKYLNGGAECTPDKTYPTLIANEVYGTASLWWLRSPNADYDNRVFFVYFNGTVGHRMVDDRHGVRAAFQITI